MIEKKTLITILFIAGTVGTLAWAQPPDYAVFPGDERARQGRWQEDQLEKMTEFLELSESQAAEWQTITENHRETMRARWEQVGTLREAFGELADQDAPDLEKLGLIALDLHREMKTARASRGELMQDLEAILTPEQAERLATLKAARELAGDRGHRRPRGDRARPDRN